VGLVYGRFFLFEQREDLGFGAGHGGVEGDMSKSTLWTCDRCDTSQARENLPVGWTLTVMLPEYRDSIVNPRVHRTFCSACSNDIENVLRAQVRREP